MGNFNDMQPCSKCGSNRNVEAMDCTDGIWTCTACNRAIAEAHHAGPTLYPLPSGWWILPALIASAALWSCVLIAAARVIRK